jgi:hypothetical protein
MRIRNAIIGTIVALGLLGGTAAITAASATAATTASQAGPGIYFHD